MTRTKEKLARLKLLLLDVDGVLTDGTINYTDSGEEIKRFDSKDGLGMRLLMESGIRVGIITGRKSGALIHRCDNLGIDLVYDGVSDKAAVFDAVLQKTGVTAMQTGFAGDDLPDLPVLKKAGTAITVADAPACIKAHCDLVTFQKGGKGAVREICEAILKAGGKWETAVSKFYP